MELIRSTWLCTDKVFFRILEQRLTTTSRLMVILGRMSSSIVGPRLNALGCATQAVTWRRCVWSNHAICSETSPIFSGPIPEFPLISSKLWRIIHSMQSEFPSTASSAIGVSGHRFSLQNKCELGDSLSVTSFAHLGERKWAALGVKLCSQTVPNMSCSTCGYELLQADSRLVRSRKNPTDSDDNSAQVRRCPFSALYSSEIRSPSRMPCAEIVAETGWL